MIVKHKDTDGYRLTDGIICFSCQGPQAIWHYHGHISAIYREQLGSWDAICLDDINLRLRWPFGVCRHFNYSTFFLFIILTEVIV